MRSRGDPCLLVRHGMDGIADSGTCAVRASTEGKGLYASPVDKVL